VASLVGVEPAVLKQVEGLGLSAVNHTANRLGTPDWPVEVVYDVFEVHKRLLLRG
jgi:hypothetical protein